MRKEISQWGWRSDCWGWRSAIGDGGLPLGLEVCPSGMEICPSGMEVRPLGMEGREVHPLVTEMCWLGTEICPLGMGGASVWGWRRIHWGQKSVHHGVEVRLLGMEFGDGAPAALSGSGASQARWFSPWFSSHIHPFLSGCTRAHVLLPRKVLTPCKAREANPKDMASGTWRGGRGVGAHTWSPWRGPLQP